jgi:beta-lactamase regulating signal transducer with metallopeptidase domain
MLPLTLSAVWVIGMAVVLLPVAGTFRRLRRIRRTGVSWPAGRRHAEGLAIEAGVMRPIAVLRHDAVHVPMTCGLWRPVVLLPWDVPDWDGADLERACVHEIEHIRRLDWLLILLARFVCAAYWFHPLVWVGRRWLHMAMERACDDAVLERGEARAYAAQLVELARRLSGREQHALPAMASHGDLSARVHAIRDPTRRDCRCLL